MRLIVTLWIVGMCLPLLATAQEAPRWYQIEVLVFRNLANNAQFEEQWPQRRTIRRSGPSLELPGASTGTETRTFDLSAASIAQGYNDTARSAQMLRYTGVPSGERALAGARNRLDQRGDYRVISYHAWRQPLTADQKPLLFHVGAGNVYGATNELEGYIGLSLKRYIHVDTELWWSQPNPSDGDQASLTPTAHLVENRRMRSTETNYLDHPLIGVLLHSIPIER